MAEWPIHARFDGPIVMIGFGSIGKGTLPLLERHIAFDRAKMTVIAPDDADRGLLDARGIRFEHLALTRDNYVDVLTPLLTAGGEKGLVVNLSVDTSSVAIVRALQGARRALHRHRGRAVAGLLHRHKLSVSQRSNYALRETMLDLRRARPGGPTAVTTCGANPGMVSWLVKQALLDIARDTGVDDGGAGRSRGLGPARPAARRQGHPHRRARHAAGPDAEAAGACSSTPGGSRASCRRGCSRPNSAGARTRRSCRPKAAATTSVPIAPSTCCGRAPARACGPGRRPPVPSTVFS